MEQSVRQRVVDMGNAGSNPAVGNNFGNFFFLIFLKFFSKIFEKKFHANRRNLQKKREKNSKKYEIVRFGKIRQVALSVILIFVY